MENGLDNKVVIITGASSGIGRALAEEMTNRGANVVIAARNIEKLKSFADELTAKGKHVLAVQVDVSKSEDCARLIKETVDCYGAIDVLINNAGISMRALFEQVDLDVIRQLMDTNFWGAVFCTKHALPYLLKTKGSVVGVSSIAGYKGLPGRTGYSASKFALHGFLETLRIENRKNDLHVLIACPGFTASNIRNTALAKDGTQQGESPLNESKLMSAEAVAYKVANAIEKRRNTLILTCEGRILVLLNKLFPRFMDKVLYNRMAKEPNSPFK